MTATSDFSAREALAIETCRGLVSWYDDHGKASRIRLRTAQITIVALTAVTPVLISADIPHWLQGLPAAVAAVLGVVTTTMQWRDDWARFAVAETALRSELVRYQTQTTDRYGPALSEQQRLDAFVNQMTSIEQIETQHWERALEAARRKDGPATDTHSGPRQKQRR